MKYLVKREKLDRLIKNIKTFSTDGIYETLEKIGHLVNASIKDRIETKGAGSYKGKTYSKSYAKYRKKKGRQDSKRDLHLSGRMWAAQDVDIIKNKGAVLFFRGVEDNAKAEYNQAMTPFFELKQKEENIVYDELNRALRGIK